MAEPKADLPRPGAEALVVDPSTATPKEVILQQAVTQDFTVLRFAVLGLIAAAVLALLGVIYLTDGGKEVPEGVIAIGSACVGALSTLLVRAPDRG